MKQILTILLLLSFLLFKNMVYSQENKTIINATKKSKNLQLSLKIINFKRFVFKEIKQPKRKTKNFNENKFDKSLTVSTLNVEGFKVITIKNSNSCNKHIIYFHGGAYVLEASKAHKKIIEYFVLENGYKVTFIDYPKAPENNYKTTHRIIFEAYQIITKNYSQDTFIFIGYSAEGGLALSFLQVLRDKNSELLPAKTILASPWLDLTMSNDSINKYKEKDVILPIDGLIYAAELYSDGENKTNPLLSPIYGEMNNLGDILIIFGTNEIFYPDCLKFIEIAKKSENVNVIQIIGDNLMHDWIVFPSKETDKTLLLVCEFINK